MFVCVCVCLCVCGGGGGGGGGVLVWCEVLLLYEIMYFVEDIESFQLCMHDWLKVKNNLSANSYYIA